MFPAEIVCAGEGAVVETSTDSGESLTFERVRRVFEGVAAADAAADALTMVFAAGVMESLAFTDDFVPP